MSEKEYKIKCENMFAKNTILINKIAELKEQIEKMKNDQEQLKKDNEILKKRETALYNKIEELTKELEQMRKRERIVPEHYLIKALAENKKLKAERDHLIERLR